MNLREIIYHEFDTNHKFIKLRKNYNFQLIKLKLKINVYLLQQMDIQELQNKHHHDS